MFEQTFKNVDNILFKDAGCTNELDYTEQSSWLLFLKCLDALEHDKAAEAALEGKTYSFILAEAFRWERWAAPKTVAMRRPCRPERFIAAEAGASNVAAPVHSRDMCIGVGWRRSTSKFDSPEPCQRPDATARQATLTPIRVRAPLLSNGLRAGTH